MTRSFPLLLVLLLALPGCPEGGADDDDSAANDDDDSAANDDDDSAANDDDDSAANDDDDSAANDDDDSAANDDDDSAANDDDDSAANDDDDSAANDDDDSAANDDGCAPEAVTGEASCSLVPSTPVALDSLAGLCPGGDYVFQTQSDWDTFLGGTCYTTPLLDPLAGFDWTAQDVLGRITGTSGCDIYGGFLWVADCGGTRSFASWAEGCGDCDGFVIQTQFVAVDAAVTPHDFFSCTPDSFSCGD